MFKNATAMDGRSSDLKSWKAVMLIAVLFISLLAMVAVADSESTDATDSISVSPSSATLFLNKSNSDKSVLVTVSVTASDLTGLKVTATSGTMSVASVTTPSSIDTDKKSTFTVTGLSSGSSTITVKLVKDDTTTVDTKTVSISVKKVVKGITIKDGSTTVSQTTINLYTKAEKTLTAVLDPTDATVKTYKWSSNKTDVVTVDEKTGKITAKSPGTARITVTSDDPDAATTAKSNYVDVKVEDKKVTGITVSPTSGTVKIRHEITLVATIAPADATYLTLNVTPDKTSMLEVVSQTPSSTEPNKVTIVLKGIGQTAGVVKVTITSTEPGSTVKAEATITTETIPVKSVDITKSSAELETDETLTLDYKIDPPDATNLKVTWSSSNPTVATIDKDTGVIKPLIPGKTTITVTTDEKVAGKAFTDTCEVTVLDTITIDGQVDSKGQVQNAAKILEEIKGVVAKGLSPSFNISASNCTTVTMSSDLIEALQYSYGGQMVVAMQLGQILFDEDAIQSIDTSGKETGISFKSVDTKDYPKFEKCYIYDISILSDGKEVETIFGIDEAKIAIYHKLLDGEDATKLIAGYVFADGDAVELWDYTFVEDEYSNSAVVIYAPHMSKFIFMFHDSEYISTAGINTTIAIVFLVIIVILAAGIAFFTFNENASEKLQNLFKRNNTKRPPMSPPGQDPYGYYQNNQFNGYGNNYSNYNNNNGNNNYR